METLTIIVTPVPHRPGFFTATYNGKRVCTSRQPLLTAARHFVAAGWPPDTVVAMYHASNPDVLALKSRIGVAARLIVRDDKTTGPIFENFNGRYGPTCRPTMRPNGVAATPMAPKAGRA